MREFARLFDELESTGSTAEKTAALAGYFARAAREAPADAAWVLAVLLGRRLRRIIPSGELRDAAAEAAGLPRWLLDECASVVGDGSETIALLLPDPDPGAADLSLEALVRDHLRPLPRLDAKARRQSLCRTWCLLPRRERFLFHKMLSGTFRVGVSRGLAIRAVAQAASLPPAVIDQRVQGEWDPSAEWFASLMRRDDPPRPDAADVSETVQPAALLPRPLPFFLAKQLDEPPAGGVLGDVAGWLAEWKWDGLRAQLIASPDAAAIWSRGEENLSANFPELIWAGRDLASKTACRFIIDGELVAWRAASPHRVAGPAEFARLQTRINRPEHTPRLFVEVPVAIIAYDLLWLDARDLRAEPVERRRELLEALVCGGTIGAWAVEQIAPITPERGDSRQIPAAPPDPANPPVPIPGAAPAVWLSPLMRADAWSTLEAIRAGSRAMNAEGLMLKRAGSVYGSGRTGDAWWKWKVEPLRVDAVLTMGQRGSGRRAGLYTDLTFSLWSGAQPGQGELVPIAKAYSGLDDDELHELDRWIRTHATSRFGPVTGVEPTLVFELAFEAVSISPRHRGGLAVRFPRIARWRRDKRAPDADTLATLRAMLRHGQRAENQL